MAKISELAASAVLTGDELVVVVQGGVTYRSTVAQVRRVPIFDDTTTALTLALTHAGGIVRQSNAGAITTTVPANATVAFPIGTSIGLRQVGAGAITVSPAGGVTINTPSGHTAVSRAQGSSLALIKVATDTWDLTGDLA